MLSDKYKNGDKITDIYLLKKFEIKQAKNNTHFADVLLANREEEIPAKMWDIKSELADSVKTGNFAKVHATVQLYNDNIQFIIHDISAIEPTDDEINRLVECSPYPPEKMYEKLVSLINDGANEDIKKLTLALMEDNKEKLLYYPAAKSFHHAMKGGLMYHTYSMFRAASSLLEIYDFLDKDLVYAGIALHDIGKIKEIDSDKYGTAEKYSAQGQLLGHITIMICDIDAKARELGTDPEITMLLKHILLSHHYYPEFGSPVVPMIAEAELVHHLDVLDARMDQFKKTLQQTPEKNFSDRVWILDKRSVYNHSLKDERNERE